MPSARLGSKQQTHINFLSDSAGIRSIDLSRAKPALYQFDDCIWCFNAKVPYVRYAACGMRMRMSFFLLMICDGTSKSLVNSMAFAFAFAFAYAPIGTGTDCRIRTHIHIHTYESTTVCLYAFPCFIAFACRIAHKRNLSLSVISSISYPTMSISTPLC